MIVWAAMRKRLWPNADFGKLIDEARTFLTTPDASRLEAAFIAEAGDDAPIGFIELTIQPFIDGCMAMREPHIEGWFVEEAARSRGAGRALIAAAEAWSREFGFSELISKTKVTNAGSRRAFEGCGFADVKQPVTYRKVLAPAGADS